MLETPFGSEDERTKTKKCPRFKMSRDDSDICLEKGLIFNTKKEVKKVLKTFAMVNKKNLVVKKNDKVRYVVKRMLIVHLS